MASTAAAQGRIVLKLDRRFAASRDRVFAAWTTPETLRRWWCPAGWTPGRIEVDLRVQGAYYLEMRDENTGSSAAVRGQFLEVSPPARLVYTWRWVGALDNMIETRVTVEFLDDNGGTRLVLTHESLPDVTLWHRHRAGWIAACDRMERVLG